MRSAGLAGRVRLIVLGVAIAAGAAFALTRFDFVEDTVKKVVLPLEHEDIIRQQARDKNVDAALIAAVIYAESRFRDQTSHAGARGLMQITPDTADLIEKLSGGTTFVHEDLAKPQLNIQYGTYYLRYLLDRYGENEVAALAAYNAGPGNADEWGGSELEVEDIEFPETSNYVAEVLSKRDEYRENYAAELGL